MDLAPGSYSYIAYGWMHSIKSNFIGSRYIFRFNNILNALEILWENQFDQTALMLIIHSYHNWQLDIWFCLNQTSEIFKGNCLFQILALVSRKYLSPPRRWGTPANPISSYQKSTSSQICFGNENEKHPMWPCPSFRRQVSFSRWSSPQTPGWVQCKPGKFEFFQKFSRNNNLHPTSISFSSLSRTISFSNLSKHKWH